MSFPQILYIWLAVLFAAYISGWVAHIMGRGARHLSGVSYLALIRRAGNGRGLDHAAVLGSPYDGRLRT